MPQRACKSVLELWVFTQITQDRMFEKQQHFFHVGVLEPYEDIGASGLNLKLISELEFMMFISLTFKAT